MRLPGMPVSAALLFFAPAFLFAGADFSSDQLSLLHDTSGWEILKMTSPQSGIQTDHACFDGKPHPDTCSGTLTLRADGSFEQRVVIHKQSVSRTGTYELAGDQLSFYDEFGTRDGPYTVQIDPVGKTMLAAMPQVKMELQLYREYRKALDAQNSKHRK